MLTDFKRPGPGILVIFGAGGDLTWRKLLPALFDLYVEEFLPEQFAIIGLDRKESDDQTFRERARDGVEKFARFKDEIKKEWEGFAEALYYITGEADDTKTYKTLAKKLATLDKAWEDADEINHLFYLSTPPFLIEPITKGLADTSLLDDRESTRIVVEKPFGHDLTSAVALNKKLLNLCPESQIYRIDHYLGKETVQNILAFRFANALFEPIWDRRYIDHVQITVAESVGVGHRGGYYDKAGALRDMVQNHLMQILCLVAMEPPVSFGAEEIRNRKVEVLRAVRPIELGEVSEVAARGQYDEGWVQGEHVQAYLDEENVAPRSSTETFAALKLYVDNWRWRGVPFYLRSGKHLTERVSEVVIRFKPVPHQAFPHQTANPFEPNDIIIHLQPDEGIALEIQAKKPGLSMRLGEVDMNFSYEQAFHQPSPEAYETLLLDVFRGDPTLFMRSDQVELAWAIVMPILEVWAQAEDTERYDSGSWGPDGATELIARDGRSWLRPQRLGAKLEKRPGQAAQSSS